MFKICVSWDDKLYKLLGPNPQVGFVLIILTICYMIQRKRKRNKCTTFKYHGKHVTTDMDNYG